jgi:FtsP/CotA-like multicopper oxidase with cupredoxin domain
MVAQTLEIIFTTSTVRSPTGAVTGHAGSKAIGPGNSSSSRVATVVVALGAGSTSSTNAESITARPRPARTTRRSSPQWMVQCHNAYHCQASMMGQVGYNA